MKITELLQKLDLKNPKQEYHYIVILSDYSGYIKDCTDDEVLDFSDKEEMNEKLTALWDDLTRSKAEWEI